MVTFPKRTFPVERRVLMTIKDIAKLSGVGVSTVSRVLNNSPDVSDASRKKVLEVIKKYNYVPNNSARDLVRTKIDAVGVIVRGLQNPFFTGIIRSIERDLDASGFTMVMRQIESNADEIKSGAIMEREKRLRGIIFLGGRSDYSREEIALINVPFVCCTYTNVFGTLSPEEYSSVSIVDELEAKRAVEYLLKNGHRKIAALNAGTEDSSVSQLRSQGYVKALKDFGIDTAEIISTNDYSIENGYYAMKERLKQPFDCTALFVIADDMAIGAMRALRENGIRVPEDCSIISIDGITVSEYIQPMLTTLCQPVEELGSRSVQILLELINGGEQQHVTLSTVLRTGESVRSI